MKHYCTNCKYEMEKENIPPKCPYCSMEGTIRDKETAQELIDNIADEMELINESRRDRGY